jgi:hypothetical protein
LGLFGNAPGAYAVPQPCALRIMPAILFYGLLALALGLSGSLPGAFQPLGKGMKGLFMLRLRFWLFLTGWLANGRCGNGSGWRACG